MAAADKIATITRLKKEVLGLEDFKRPSIKPETSTILNMMEGSFPDGCFPVGTVHELISYHPCDHAATHGFIAALIGSGLFGQQGYVLWVSTQQQVFPAALAAFGVTPQKVIFVTSPNMKDALWITEEALKCKCITAVIGEFSELDFKQSRRLQLAVEQSRVTGFIHRHSPRAENIVACTTRWKIIPIPSQTRGEMPGVGLPRWRIELAKVRNGRPGIWEVEWRKGRFHEITSPKTYQLSNPQRKTG